MRGCAGEEPVKNDVRLCWWRICVCERLCWGGSCIGERLVCPEGLHKCKDVQECLAQFAVWFRVKGCTLVSCRVKGCTLVVSCGVKGCTLVVSCERLHIGGFVGGITQCAGCLLTCQLRLVWLGKPGCCCISIAVWLCVRLPFGEGLSDFQLGTLLLMHAAILTCVICSFLFFLRPPVTPCQSCTPPWFDTCFPHL